MAIYSVLFFGISIAWLFLFRVLAGKSVVKAMTVAFVAGLASGPIAGSVTFVLRGALELPLLSDVWQNIVLFFFLVGPIEELTKFFAAFLATHRRSDFRGAPDGIFIAIAAALGFASGENLLYLQVYGPDQTLPRLILANLGHASFAVYWGYAYGVMMHERASFGLLPATLAIAALLHGLYDYLLQFHFIFALLAFCLLFLSVVFMFVFLRGEMKRTRNR